MASAPVLEIEALLAPIPGDNPSGTAPPYDVGRQLDAMRREPDAFADAGTQSRQDWGGIVQLAADTLVSTSKDLLVATRLVEGVTMHDGFAGLRDGVTFLTRLITECWDRMRPVPEEEGDTVEGLRGGPLVWLNSPGAGKFPYNLSAAPLLTIRGDRFTFGDWKGGGERRIEFEAALTKVKPDDVRNLQADLKEAKANLEVLGKVVDEKMPDLGLNLTSGMGSIGVALAEVTTAVEQIAAKAGVTEGGEGGDASSEEADADDEPTAGGSKKAARSGGLSRADLYRQVEGIADTLQRLEPHSPIPYLLKRAVRLGAMPFPQMMRDLMSEDTRPLDGLDKMLGIAAPE